MSNVVIPYTPRPEQRKIHNALDKYRWSVIVAHRRLGKTICTINQLIKQCLTCKQTRPRYAYIAPLYSQAKTIAWDYLKHYSKPIPGIKVNESELYVEYPNHGRVRLFGSDNPDALRGMYLDGVALDEVGQMKQETWGEVIRPALADRGGSAIFIGTPKGINLFFDMYQHALEDDDWYTQIYTVDDTDIIPAEELAQLRRSMSDAQFRQEMLCDFQASTQDSFISLDIVNNARNRKLERDQWAWARPVMGIDVARFGDDLSVAYTRQGRETIAINTWRHMDLMTLADNVSHCINAREPGTIFADGVGVGGGLVDRLRQLGYQIIDVNAGAQGRPGYANKRAEIWSEMKEWLKEGRIPDDQQLRIDLTTPRYKYNSKDELQLEKKEEIKKRGFKSPDLADALSLTFTMPVRQQEDEYTDDEYTDSRDTTTGY